MRAEIITIGDELLLGQTIDTNSAWLGTHLDQLGIQVKRINSISDERDAILEILEEVSQRADLVLITGGLGPTEDDITKAALCHFFESDTYLDKEVLFDIEAFFTRIGKTMLEVNVQQAVLPTKATIVRNKRGTASGMWFEKDGTVFIAMPGVPYEMKGLMKDEFLGKIAQYFQTPNIYHHTVLFQGIGETTIANEMAEWQLDLASKEIKIAYLPSPGLVRVRLSSMGNHLSEIKKEVDANAEVLKQAFPKHVFGTNEETLAEVVGVLLKQAGKTLCTAESCTGGNIARHITSVSGSSVYFKGAIVAYNEQVKINALNVDESTIEKQGVVSKEVVEMMALGASKKLKTDFSIATSGIAGPDGGTEKNPVGTVWIAIVSGSKVVSKKFLFGKNRGRNIEIASLTALNLLRLEILKE